MANDMMTVRDKVALERLKLTNSLPMRFGLDSSLKENIKEDIREAFAFAELFLEVRNETEDE